MSDRYVEFKSENVDDAQRMTREARERMQQAAARFQTRVVESIADRQQRADEAAEDVRAVIFAAGVVAFWLTVSGAMFVFSR